MKNTLLYYQGGGYDGCIWEWNACFWNEDGVWSDLFSSGCGGLTTEKEAFDLIAEYDGLIEPCRKGELVDLTNQDRILQFQKDNNAYLVLNIAKTLTEEFDYEIKLTCNHCEQQLCPDELHTIADDNYNIVCEECLCSNTCECCNEFIMDDNELIWLDEKDDLSGLYATGYSKVCKECFNYNVEQQKNDKCYEQ